nr:hypothetical protein [Vibrio genomosp. F6]
MRRQIRLLAVSTMSIMISACSTLSAGNLFSHYSAQNNAVHQAVATGQYQKAEDALPDYAAGDILDNFERGRVLFLNEQFPESKSSLELSDRAVRIQQDKAVISVSDSVTSVGALAVNDNLTEYTPADYELGFLHLYLGLNYLKENSLEGALVEMRRANQVQEQAKKIREKELQSAQSDIRSKGLSPNLGSVLSNYPDAGKKLQAVQNGYLLFLSGLLYEASNDPNAAYVDYRRALAVMPENTEIINNTIRLAKRLGMNQDLAKLTKRYGSVTKLTSNQGRVIVIEEQGVVDAMQSWRLDLPIYDSRSNGAIYSLALPYYPKQASERFSAMHLDNNRVNTSQLANINLMAQNDLSERLPSIVIRQALRVVAKDRIRKEAAKGDDVGNLLFNVWNALTEQPDTRSWQTLPAEVNSASQIVAAGEHSLQVDGHSYQFNVPKGQTTLVWVSRQGGNAIMWHKQLGRLK